MCLTCGCEEPNEDHGKPESITLEKLQEAAQAAGISEEEAVENLQRTYSHLNRKAA